ncbi:penicillin acylase family protein [Isoalcanivorax beigongshangi]|uniref:Penicillin acylase family protein n=1 Tax=Isoalcanivorax beigongshangi TaxID=3238810 RepID=A0ABV4AM57_9GAMM
MSSGNRAARAAGWAFAGLLAWGLAGCGSSSSSSPRPLYQATLERTEQGIPHITAKDYRGLGFGHGYAIAEDNLCVLADGYVTFRGERSQYFPATDRVPHQATFGQPPNLEADFFFRFVLNDAEIASFMAAQDTDLRHLSQGFAVGYNRYLGEFQRGEHAGRHQDCVGAPWLGEISEQDVFRRLLALNLAGSAANWVEAVSSALPPSAPSGAVAAVTALPEIDPGRFKVGQEEGIGSNTLSFGADATADGSAINFANPHWYLQGIDKFYQLHLRVPGKLDIAGASILGAPMVLMGFNNDVAWGHTVSTATRFTLYRLPLKPGEPTVYLQDGKEKSLVPEQVSVLVRRPDGSVETATRTLYRSEYGPMLNLSSFGLGWNDQQAFTLRDVNLENTRSFRNFFEFGQADSLDRFIGTIKSLVGIPWVNTSAASRESGEVLYSDVTAVPNVSDAHKDNCLVPVIGPLVMQRVPGVLVLDGSRSECDWATDQDSAVPGTFGPSNLPLLKTRDYVGNMNDSYWLSNPDQPLEGYAYIIGQEGTAQSLRTRLGHLMAAQRKRGEDSHGPSLASSETLRSMVLDSRNYSAELMKDEILAAVCGDAALADACAALAAWDNTGELDARGARLWSAFWVRMVKDAELYRVPFDAADPLNTPRGFNPDRAAAAATHLQAAVAELTDRGEPLDSALGEHQFMDMPGMQVPQYGGEGVEGYFTVLRNTYLHVVEFPAGAPVQAYTMLTNGVSSDPASPYYGEATQAYSDKQWLSFPYTEDEIRNRRVSIQELSQ